MPVLFVFLLGGCTFQAGTGFGRISVAQLDIALVPGPARDLGDHTILTDQGYEVAFDTLAVELSGVALQELGGGGGADFDPANPPEGYSLCHGGHCHDETGAIVSYEDIIAELSGGVAAYSDIVRAALDVEVDLLAGDRVDLDMGGELPMADISRLLVQSGRLMGRATAVDESGTTSIPLEIDLPVEAGFTALIELPLDRTHDPVITLDAALEPDGTLFDGVDLLAASGGGPLLIDDPTDSNAGQALVEQLTATSPEVTITRSPE